MKPEGSGGMGVSPPISGFSAADHSFENIAGYSGGRFHPHECGSRCEFKRQRFAQPPFRPGINPLLGRFLRVRRKTRPDQVALLSYGLWQRQFGGDRSLVVGQIYVGQQSYSSLA